MNTVVRHHCQEMIYALERALGDPLFWPLTEGLALAVAVEVSCRVSGGRHASDHFYDPLRIVLITVRIAFREQWKAEDYSLRDVEDMFWSRCPEWLAIQLGAEPRQLALSGRSLSGPETYVSGERVEANPELAEKFPELRGIHGTVMSAMPRLLETVYVLFDGEARTRMLTELQISRVQQG